MAKTSKFRDGPVIEGPLEAFLQPGSTVIFERDGDVCEGTMTIDHIDVATNTIWFTTALPAGIQSGDKVRG